MRPMRTCGAALLLALACAAPALSAPRKNDKTPPAAIDRTSSKTKEVAQKVYEQGTGHFRAGRLLEALAAFRASYDMVPSPNSHLMIARTLRDRGDLAQAFAEYGKVTIEAEAAAQRDAKYAAAAEASRSERAKLKDKLTMVVVKVKSPPDDLRIILGGRPVDRMDWEKPVPVPAGALAALATSKTRPDQRQDVVALPGDEIIVSFDFSVPPKAAAVGPTKRPEAPSDGLVSAGADGPPDIPRQGSRKAAPPPDRSWAYASLGVGAAGLATFVIFGTMNQSIYNDLKETCPGGHCSPSRSDDVDRGRRDQVIANVGLGTAFVAGTLGVVLLTSAFRSDPAPSEVAKSAAHGEGLRLRVIDVSLGPASFGVRGAF